ncbi:hypothetical protein ECG_02070 [Echinococcus granulosus]|nr:hypothetical protein ECG_02070 [Echinococcus granulosus]
MGSPEIEATTAATDFVVAPPTGVFWVWMSGGRAHNLIPASGQTISPITLVFTFSRRLVKIFHVILYTLSEDKAVWTHPALNVGIHLVPVENENSQLHSLPTKTSKQLRQIGNRFPQNASSYFHSYSKCMGSLPYPLNISGTIGNPGDDHAIEKLSDGSCRILSSCWSSEASVLAIAAF